MITAALEKWGGDKAKAAKELGMNLTKPIRCLGVVLHERT
jgi:hypothetical protein